MKVREKCKAVALQLKNIRHYIKLTEPLESHYNLITSVGRV